MCARSSVIEEGLEDNTAGPHPELELAVREGAHAPPSCSWSTCAKSWNLAPSTLNQPQC